MRSRTRVSATSRLSAGKLASGPRIDLGLSADELDALIRIAHYYERSMGPMRYVVRWTAGSEVRQKYQFIAQESLWLERLLLATRQESDASNTSVTSLALTPRALVAVWGRLLSSTRNRRARRKARPAELHIRENIARKCRDGARELASAHAELLEQEIETRRADEAAWMREELSPSAPQLEEPLPTS